VRASLRENSARLAGPKLESNANQLIPPNTAGIGAQRPRPRINNPNLGNPEEDSEKRVFEEEEQKDNKRTNNFFEKE